MPLAILPCGFLACFAEGIILLSFMPMLRPHHRGMREQNGAT